MPDFGIFRGFGSKLFSDKLYAGQLPTQLGLIGSEDANIFLLDLYPSAAAAYSLRLLRLAYTGSAIKVRNSSNSELDIGFVNNVLDTASLLTHCGSGDGFVTTWYDQSGNARNVTETTLVNQPQIVSGGSIINLNTKPAISFSGTNNLQNTSANFISPTYFFIASQSSTTADRYYMDGSQSSNRVGIYQSSLTLFYQAFATNNAGTLGTVMDSTSKITAGLPNLLTLVKNGSSTKIYENNNDIGSGVFTTDSMIGLTIGSRFNKVQGFTDKMREIIIYTSDQSSNRTGISNNINTYYSIY